VALTGSARSRAPRHVSHPPIILIHSSSPPHFPLPFHHSPSRPSVSSPHPLLPPSTPRCPAVPCSAPAPPPSFHARGAVGSTASRRAPLAPAAPGAGAPAPLPPARGAAGLLLLPLGGSRGGGGCSSGAHGARRGRPAGRGRPHQ
jgi:hypothetical protein